MKLFYRFSLMLLALLLPALATAYDFEVNGIYYLKNGTNATVTHKGSNPSEEFYTVYVTIPSSVTYGGITYSVTSIGEGAFDSFHVLTNINIPNSVTSIGDDAFRYCRMTAINIPKSVTSIGNMAFSNCSSLATISVASDNPKYDSRNNCNAIIETATNTLIAGCMNTTIPNSVTTIGDVAFSGCYYLTNINIPNSVKTIGNYAFWDCIGLTTINIPNSVTTIGDEVFSGCSSLATISVASDNPKYDSRNNCNAIIETATNTLIAGCMNTTIPNSVTTIGEGAFDDCTGLTSINIPNSVTTIGDEAFYGCSGLTSIDIPNSVTTIGDDAFWDCTGLTSINIPKSVTSIGDDAFYQCSGLKDVYSYIDNLSLVSMDCSVFYLYFANYNKRTLHVPVGTLEAYQADTKWSQYFDNIVEMEP